VIAVNISEKLIEIREYHQPGYGPLVDFGHWRVAVLNYSADLHPEKITAMQRHNLTDEVFVLLRGRCLLFVSDGSDCVTSIQAENMSPFTAYNIKQAVWHSHTLSEDAMVLIIENRDTTYDNSPFCTLSTDQRRDVIGLSKAWGF
jgi:ureidoglycolate hydrolase